MTQPGETEGYTVSDHIKELFRHSSKNMFDMCLVNDLVLPQSVVKRYDEEGAAQLIADIGEIGKLGIEVFSAPLVEHHNDLVRHDPDKLAREIMDIFYKKAPIRLYNGRKVL
jgi:uncharacterized cofD-like protein